MAGPTTKLDELIGEVQKATEAANGAAKAANRLADRYRFGRNVVIIMGFFVVLLVAVSIVVGITVIRLNGVVDDVQQSQIASCEAGNNFRRATIEFNDQRDIDYSRALAQVLGGTQEDLERFLTILAENRVIPESFQPRDCEALYG